MSAMMHRTLRLTAFLAGLLLGGVGVLFAFDNPARISLAIGGWQFQAVPVWAIAIVPLVAGVAAGYLYHLPARMHHLGEHMRHRSLVHGLRKENEELSRSLDRLLAMPNDDSPAIAAAARARDVTPAPEALVPAPVEESVVVVATAAEVAAPRANGHARRHPAAGHAESAKESTVALPAERPAPSPRPGRTRRPRARPDSP